MFQFLRDHKRGGVWEQRVRQLESIKLGLVQMRAMLTEAAETEEVVKTAGAKQFLRALGHQVMSIEHHIDGMLE